MDLSSGVLEGQQRSGAEHEPVADARLDAANERDALAQTRDLAALSRDRVADTRALGSSGAATGEDRDHGDRTETAARQAARRTRAARHRAHAANQRELAAADRHAAALDRAQAARERLQALADREALVIELQRAREHRDQALQLQRHAEDLARTLQRSLSPPSLPRIAGLEVAVHYEPFATEAVGGDFYDLFPLSPHRCGFFLGDVCGKGPEAAAVTSLARYTIRTAAMFHVDPDAILMELNAALLMQSDESMQTCTAIYGELDRSDGGGAVTLAAAGHPAPLIVRVDGSVEATPTRGTMLGAVRDPAFLTCAVDLDPGDAIMLYSDGMLDTEIDGIRSDERRIATLLAGTPRASAQSLVQRLVHAVQSLDRPLRDDVAFMALRRTQPA